MIIKFASPEDIEEALQLINPYWNDNIQFSKFIEEPYFAGWKVTLRVKDSNGAGHSITRPGIYGNRIATACWHVHYTFFLELPDDAVVFNGKHWIARREPHLWKPWFRHGIPILMLCECEHYRGEYDPRNPKRIPTPAYNHHL